MVGGDRDLSGVSGSTAAVTLVLVLVLLLICALLGRRTGAAAPQAWASAEQRAPKSKFPLAVKSITFIKSRIRASTLLFLGPRGDP